MSYIIYRYGEYISAYSDVSSDCKQPIVCYFDIPQKCNEAIIVKPDNFTVNCFNSTRVQIEIRPQGYKDINAYILLVFSGFTFTFIKMQCANQNKYI